MEKYLFDFFSAAYEYIIQGEMTTERESDLHE